VSDVFPCFTSDNLPDSGLVDSKYSSNVFLTETGRFVKLFYFLNVFIREFLRYASSFDNYIKAVIRNAFPIHPVDNVSDLSSAHSENNPQSLLGIRAQSVKASYFSNLIIGEFCIEGFLAIRHSTLLNCIRNIIRLRSEPKMRGINARRIVAVMANIHAPWNRSIGEYPRNLMRASLFFPRRSLANSSMPEWPLSSIENPTLSHDFNLREKATYYGLRESEGFQKFLGGRLTVGTFFEKLHSSNQVCFGYSTPRAVRSAPRHFSLWSRIEKESSS